MKFSEMSLTDLQDWRDKSKGSQLVKVKNAINNYFLPAKPKKVKKRDKKRRFPLDM